MIDNRSSELAAKKRVLLEALLRKDGVEIPRSNIPRRAEGTPVPLSFAQESLWVFEQMMPGTALYNIATAVRLSGTLQVRALALAVDELVRRHESLRTTFEVAGEDPVQVIAPDVKVPLTVVDLHQPIDAEREANLQDFLDKEAHKPFDLSHGPLVRFILCRVSTQEHVLLLVMHHIISEASSVAILLRELSSTYEAFTTGKLPMLPDLSVQYGDYAVWQRQAAAKEERLEAQLDWWRKQLHGRLPVLELPTDRPRPSVRTTFGGWRSIEISAATAAALRRLSRQEGATMFITLLASYAALLYRYTGQEDLIVGSPATNRSRPELENVIGYFVNPQPLRIDVSGSPTFRELLRRVREFCLAALENRNLPLERLMEELNLQRDPSSNPLFQTAFVLHNTSGQSSWKDALKLPDLVQHTAVVRTRTAKLDLTLEVEDNADTLTAVFEYNADLFDEATIIRMAGHFERMLDAIGLNADESIAQLPLMTPDEQRLLLVDWNATQTDYPRHASIQELFEAQARGTPEAIAAVFAAPGEPPHAAPTLTYDELNRRANRVAHHLIGLGIEADSLVGLCMDRSLEMLVSIIGILKAGGGYVPLDPGYPPERLARMIADTNIKVLVTQKNLAQRLPAFNGTLLEIGPDGSEFSRESDVNPPTRSGAANIAYVMFTSGSTGIPKGAAVMHRGVVRLVRNTNYAEFGAGEIFLHFAPISFDASTLELWGPLLNGGRVVMFPPAMPALEELGRVIREYGVTTLWLTSALFRVMVEQRLDDLRGVRQLLSGGDVLPPAQVNRVVQELECQLINGYGPTENTTFTCCYRIPKNQSLAGSVPIGRPIANTRVYILDARMKPVPVGVYGELYIAGDGLARGYINRPELTAERFVSSALAEEPDTRLYKTGDVVRYRQNGDIEFLGRRDHQVKLRGYRIELGEIESALGRHPSLKEVAATIVEVSPGDKRLVAYVVPQPGRSSDAGELRSFLRATLPEYMVPSLFIDMAALPLSPNGKVDRKALPSIGDGRRVEQTGYVAPRNETERALIQIWQEILRVEPIGIHANFFELGGDSLMTTRVMSRVNRRFGTNLPLRALFEEGTIADLASRLSCLSGSDRWASRWEKRTWSSLIPIQPKGTRQPLFLVAGAHAHEDDLLRFLSNLIPHLGLDQPVIGFMARGLDGVQQPHDSVEEMAADYIRELLEFQPEGPYFIAGECIGGIVAYEMAQQLYASGRPVEFLALLDTIRPDEEFRKLVDSIYAGWKFQQVVSDLRRLLAVNPREAGQYLLKKVARKIRRSLPSSEHTRRANHIRHVEENYPRVLSRYMARPYPGRLTLILNEETCREYSHGRWEGMALGGLEVHRVPGNHVTRLTEHADSVAETLTMSLNQLLPTGAGSVSSVA